MTANLDEFELGIAASKIYDFVCGASSATGTSNWPSGRLMGEDEEPEAQRSRRAAATCW